MQIMPRTRLGWWSVGLVIVFALLLSVLSLLAAAGQTGGETFSANPLLAIPGISAAVSGIAAMVAGIMGITRSKERSVIALIATAIGLLITWFVIGELLLAH